MTAGTVIATIGTLRDTYDVTAPHGGRVVEWLVEDGDPVSPGQPLLRLHPPGLTEGCTMSPATITAPEGARHARIWGIGGYRPRRVVPNAEIVDAIDSSDEWIRERSGIIERRWAGEGESVVEMSEAASRDALAMAGLSPEQVSAVIVATVSHPYQTPAAAPLLAHRLGATDAAAFDISAACAGYCHAISLANDMVRGGSAEYVLVVGVERLSDFTDKHDRGTAFIFADGAGAAVVGPSDTPGIGPTVWGSDGAQWDVIAQRDSWIDVHDRRTSTGPRSGCRARASSAGPCGAWPRSPRRPSTSPASRADDLDAFIPHQANVRIIDAMAKQLQAARRPPDRPRHRPDGQHLGGVRPARHRADAPRGRRPPRRPRAPDRLRRRPGVCRAGRRPALTAHAHPDRTPVGPRVPGPSTPHTRASATDVDPTDEGAHHHGC